MLSTKYDNLRSLPLGRYDTSLGHNERFNRQVYSVWHERELLLVVPPDIKLHRISSVAPYNDWQHLSEHVGHELSDRSGESLFISLYFDSRCWHGIDTFELTQKLRMSARAFTLVSSLFPGGTVSQAFALTSFLRSIIEPLSSVVSLSTRLT